MKNKVIFFLSILLVVVSILYFSKKEIIKTVTKTTVKYDTIINTIDNTKPQQIKKVVIKVPVEVIKNDTVEKIVYKDKEVQKYVYNDTLKNGVIKSTILANKIYKRDIELKTFNKETKVLIKEMYFKPQIYIGGTTTLNYSKELLNVSLGVFYVRKKWIGSIGIGYDNYNKQPITNFTIAFKL